MSDIAWALAELRGGRAVRRKAYDKPVFLTMRDRPDLLATGKQIEMHLSNGNSSNYRCVQSDLMADDWEHFRD